MSTIDLSNAVWRKSSRTNGQFACVEVANLDAGHRAVRDSKDPRGPALIVPARAWSAFTAGIRDGAFG